MQKLTPAYVVGLVDGDGSFTVYVRNPDVPHTARRRTMVEPKFYLKLVERDKDVLCALQDFFGCGSVYYQKDNRPNHQHCYRYEVFRWEDLHNNIIPFFRKNQLQFATKRHDFRIFCKILQLLRRGAHRDDAGVRELFDLKQQMH